MALHRTGQHSTAELGDLLGVYRTWCARKANTVEYQTFTWFGARTGGSRPGERGRSVGHDLLEASVT